MSLSCYNCIKNNPEEAKKKKPDPEVIKTSDPELMAFCSIECKNEYNRTEFEKPDNPDRTKAKQIILAGNKDHIARTLKDYFVGPGKWSDYPY